MIIDFHTHAFAPAVATHALTSLMERSGMLPCTDGTVAGLQQAMQRAGINHSVVLPIATKPSQHQIINDFAYAVNQADTLTCFGSVYPLAPDALDTLDRIHELGLQGIKLHPEYQAFDIDDPRVFPIYEKASRLGLITVFHCGVDIGYGSKPARTSPARMRAILDCFSAPVVASHLGGWLQWDEVLTHLAGTDIYLDTAFLYGRIPHQLAEQIVHKHDAKRILFGSDSPWSETEHELHLVRSLKCSPEREAAILGGNAARLLGLSATSMTDD